MSSKIINISIYYKAIFSMFDKINEYMRGDNIKQSNEPSLMQISIWIAPKRRITIDEYRRRQMAKIDNSCEILEDSSMRPHNQIENDESYHRRREQCRINMLNYRQRKRDEKRKNHPKPKPLTASEKSKRYRDKKKNLKN